MSSNVQYLRCFFPMLSSSSAHIDIIVTIIVPRSVSNESKAERKDRDDDECEEANNKKEEGNEF